MAEKAYIIIDMKSFYASCECVARGLLAMTTDLVVADPERGKGTICLGNCHEINYLFGLMI